VVSPPSPTPNRAGPELKNQKITAMPIARVWFAIGGRAMNMTEGRRD
jgi:hypothetical protein